MVIAIQIFSDSNSQGDGFASVMIGTVERDEE